MIILAIRTDKPKAELHLYDGQKKLGELGWQAQGTLADTINDQLDKLLNKSSILLKDIKGIVCFKGPGSFTGLRIGMSVGNALAYSLNIPIVARKGRNWLKQGIEDLKKGKDEKITTPFYDRPALTTKPKK